MFSWLPHICNASYGPRVVTCESIVPLQLTYICTVLDPKPFTLSEWKLCSLSLCVFVCGPVVWFAQRLINAFEQNQPYQRTFCGLYCMPITAMDW